ncbi:hypothetical protein EIN_080070 [Entamoeba invadens IP1]|uniref:hypothetical protein n=1 Tax=Entamoeba invadens IP1 TaxID=370355 RepID=UPI0002C3FA20|nr:hypothetical protein EIN_080070 [Entamoeba invadens IP1]ELP85055.1 hypothetical protein EIN_080070 [Entamoeba invadens IP1]|eukprot:XP_004184401.1 hypothetical protein EIN_080070 [Entamoeba invadens IP1]
MQSTRQNTTNLKIIEFLIKRIKQLELKQEAFTKNTLECLIEENFGEPVQLTAQDLDVLGFVEQKILFTKKDGFTPQQLVQERSRLNEQLRKVPKELHFFIEELGIQINSELNKIRILKSKDPNKQFKTLGPSLKLSDCIVCYNQNKTLPIFIKNPESISDNPASKKVFPRKSNTTFQEYFTSKDFQNWMTKVVRPYIDTVKKSYNLQNKKAIIVMPQELSSNLDGLDFTPDFFCFLKYGTSKQLNMATMKIFEAKERLLNDFNSVELSRDDQKLARDLKNKHALLFEYINMNNVVDNTYGEENLWKSFIDELNKNSEENKTLMTPLTLNTFLKRNGENRSLKEINQMFVDNDCKETPVKLMGERIVIQDSEIEKLCQAFKNYKGTPPSNIFIFDIFDYRMKACGEHDGYVRKESENVNYIVRRESIASNIAICVNGSGNTINLMVKTTAKEFAALKKKFATNTNVFIKAGDNNWIEDCDVGHWFTNVFYKTIEEQRNKKIITGKVLLIIPEFFQTEMKKHTKTMSLLNRDIQFVPIKDSLFGITPLGRLETDVMSEIVLENYNLICEESPLQQNEWIYQICTILLEYLCRDYRIINAFFDSCFDDRLVNMDVKNLSLEAQWVVDLYEEIIYVKLPQNASLENPPLQTFVVQKINPMFQKAMRTFICSDYFGQARSLDEQNIMFKNKFPWVTEDISVLNYIKKEDVSEKHSLDD